MSPPGVDNCLPTHPQHAYIRYLLPLALFLSISAMQGEAITKELFWHLYGFKIAATMVSILFLFRSSWHEITGKADALSLVAGMVVLAGWVIHYRISPSHSQQPFNIGYFDSFAAATAAFFVKCVGSSVVVPLMEELAFRSFLMRYLIQRDFLSIAPGRYTFLSFWVTTLTFTLMHPFGQWPAAALAALVYGTYLVWTANLWGCIVAHGVTNLGIAVYAVGMHDWPIWA
jgi:CAAX prenyl protease-like protein